MEEFVILFMDILFNLFYHVYFYRIEILLFKKKVFGIFSFIYAKNMYRYIK